MQIKGLTENDFLLLTKWIPSEQVIYKRELFTSWWTFILHRDPSIWPGYVVFNLSYVNVKIVTSPPFSQGKVPKKTSPFCVLFIKFHFHCVTNSFIIHFVSRCLLCQTFQHHFDNISTPFWQYFNTILTIFQHHFDNILTTFQQHFDNILTPFWQYFNNISTTFWQHFVISRIPVFSVNICLHFSLCLNIQTDLLPPF